MARPQIWVQSWKSRTRISALFCRRSSPEFNFVYAQASFATALTYFSFSHFDVESTDNSNCTESQLTLCESQFNENSLPVCLEVIELKTCLTACENIKEWSSWNVYTKYEALVRKMNSYPDCIPESKGRYVIYFLFSCYGVFKHNIGLSFVYCNIIESVMVEKSMWTFQRLD